jgi:hypothetical protein
MVHVCHDWSTTCTHTQKALLVLHATTSPSSDPSHLPASTHRAICHAEVGLQQYVVRYTVHNSYLPRPSASTNCCAKKGTPILSIE